MSSSTMRAAAQLALALATIVAIVSIGGGFFAAPVLVVGHWWAVRNSHGLVRVGWIVLAMLITAEFAWGITYVVLGERMPYIWLLPFLTSAAVGFALTASTRERHPALS